MADCFDGAIYASAVAQAMDYAMRMGAHVVSCSFGASLPWQFYPFRQAPFYEANFIKAYDRAIAPLQDKGILVVAAAGNENIDMDNLYARGYSYNPCLIPRPNVLCIMATDENDAAAPFSNYGPMTVHVAAPGRTMLSTMAGAAYGTMSGTSMAAPVVSGTAALVLSVLGAADGNYYRALQVGREQLCDA